MDGCERDARTLVDPLRFSLAHRFDKPSEKTQPSAPTIAMLARMAAARFAPSNRMNQRIATNAPSAVSGMTAAVAFMNR